MRLIKTHAKDSLIYIKRAEALVLEALRTGNKVGLSKKLADVFKDMPQMVQKSVDSLALYEALFTAKQIKKKPLSKEVVLEKAANIKVSLTTGKPPVALESVYKLFAAKNAKQYMQTVRDARALNEDPEVTSNKVKEQTKGLFTTQNLAIAGLAVLGTMAIARGLVAKKYDLQVNWVLDLNLHNCDYCIEMADNSPYDPADVEGEIPVHVRCGCALIPDLSDL